MATMTSAAESTANINTSQLVRQVDDQLHYLDPSAAPFTLLSRKGDKQQVDSYKFEWAEKERSPKYDQVNNGAGYTSGATSVVVDNGAYFQAGDIVKVPRTGEVILVSSISTNTLTVVRGVGSTSAAALVDNDDQLQVVAA